MVTKMTNPLTYYSKNGHLLFPLPPLSINKIEHLPKIVTEIIGISSSSLSLIKSPKSCLGPTLHIHPSFYLIFHLFFYHYSELFFFFFTSSVPCRSLVAVSLFSRVSCHISWTTPKIIKTSPNQS